MSKSTNSLATTCRPELPVSSARMQLVLHGALRVSLRALGTAMSCERFENARMMRRPNCKKQKLWNALKCIVCNVTSWHEFSIQKTRCHHDLGDLDVNLASVINSFNYKHKMPPRLLSDVLYLKHCCVMWAPSMRDILEYCPHKLGVLTCQAWSEHEKAGRAPRCSLFVVHNSKRRVRGCVRTLIDLLLYTCLNSCWSVDSDKSENRILIDLSPNSL